MLENTEKTAHRHTILLAEGMPTIETDQEKQVLVRGQFHRLHPHTRTGSTHYSHRIFRHILVCSPGLRLFLNLRSNKHLSCYIMFSLDYFTLVSNWLTYFVLFWGFYTQTSSEDKNIHLPGLSVVLTEL